MNSQKNSHLIKKWLPQLLIILGSTALFTFYIQKNMSTLYYDEVRYFDLSNWMLSNGLFKLGADVPHLNYTTYFYPLMITFVRFFYNGRPEIIKGLFAVLQYAGYIFTIYFIAYTASRLMKSKGVVIPILAAGLLNIYMIQACTLLLTDLVSACILVFSLYGAILSDLNRPKNIFATLGLSFINVMVRPSALIFVMVTFAILVYRYFRKDFVVTKTFFLISACSLLVFLPQLYINRVNFHVWSPLVASNLYNSQSIWSVQMLKYATVVIDGENPRLIYLNPFFTKSSTNYFGLLADNFYSFLYVTLIHMFAVIDWGYVDTYITKFFPITRIVGSIGLYASWFFTGCGLFCVYIQNFKTRMNLAFLQSKANFFYACLLFTAVIYMGFLATTAPETRFGYPIFLILLPFCGFGIDQMKQHFQSLPSNCKKASEGIKLLCAVLLVMTLLFFLSFSLDRTTGRIYWTSHFKHLIYAQETIFFEGD